jgi:hypothetical protein
VGYLVAFLLHCSPTAEIIFRTPCSHVATGVGWLMRGYAPRVIQPHVDMCTACTEFALLGAMVVLPARALMVHFRHVVHRWVVARINDLMAP